MKALSTEDLNDWRAEESVVQVWARHFGGGQFVDEVKAGLMC
jgi:hypothetical protein